jgi:two-component system nitrate/nitrite response regulator NarL
VNPCTLFACESQPIVLEGLRRIVDESDEFSLAGHSSGLADALKAIESVTPDVVLLDRVTGWREVQQFIDELKTVSPGSKSVLWGNDLTASECYRAIQAGVRGVFNRTEPIESLLECLREVQAGQVWLRITGEPPWQQGQARGRQPRLTPREREIVRLVAQGMKNREIAEHLGISAGTVKVHLMHVFEKTGAKDRYQLSAQARELLEDKKHS